MSKSNKFIFLLAVLQIFLVGCAVHSASNYTRPETGRAATVMGGTILALRDVQISGTKSGIGVGAGAATGATAGAAAGGDAAGAALGAIGGAVVGGVVGAVTEEALTRAGAVEFIIKQENGQKIAVVQTNEENLVVGDKVLILRSNKVRIIKDNTVGD
jgi:outer membrane lipoprotein SlyB